MRIKVIISYRFVRVVIYIILSIIFLYKISKAVKTEGVCMQLPL